MAEKHLNPGPVTPEGPVNNVIPFRRRESPPKPPDISICEIPLFVAADVTVESFMNALASAGLRLRLDTSSGRFVIDDKPHATQEK
jgi:hypothetical protein